MDSSEILRVCRLCLEPKELTDSHIIPEFIHKLKLYDDKHRMVRLADRGRRYERQRPMPQKGVRERLLCRGCEDYLNVSFEQPNLPLWRAIVERRSVGRISVQRVQAAGLEAFRYVGFDYRIFKLLLLSILWRASVASHEDYGTVDLGAHENTIREMILRREPGLPNQYPCMICLPADRNVVGLMATPIRREFNGRLAYTFLLPGAILCFVIDPAGREYWIAPKADGSLLAPLVGRDAPFVQNIVQLVASAHESTTTTMRSFAE